MTDQPSIWHAKEMTIPQVRARLFEMAEELRLPELSQLAQQLYRRRNAPYTKARHKDPDAMTQQAIRDFKAAYPDLGELEIGQHFNVNQARVSEALYGKRGER